MIEHTESGGAVTFRVKVVPRSSRASVAGEHGGALRVRVTSPPVEGAANDELVRLLARELGVPARSVEIVAGHSTKNKTVRVEGASGELLLRLALPGESAGG
ncbi:MAG TPA: DUF167 domain-containing protein [Pyrinomonadaceae bacterium]|nr:DUF167 domain-containing protein [Pyrinomonadaceae bacterium]